MNNPVISFLQDKIERRAYEQREKAIKDYYSYMTASKQEEKHEEKRFVDLISNIYYHFINSLCIDSMYKKMTPSLLD